MSGIAIPKHWRFNWPMLMGHLKKGSGGHLLHNAAGHLVKACGCSCTVLASGYPSCGCQTADYSAYLTRGAATFTVTGSTTPNALTFKGGTCGASYTGSTGPSIAGTYIVSCGTIGQCYWHAVPVGCTGSSGNTWYYVAGIQINYPAVGSINVTLYHQWHQNSTGINPFPTVTGPTTCTPLLLDGNWTRAITWTNSTSYQRWKYVIGGSCDSSCNTSIGGAPACRSGTITSTSDSNSGSPNPCGSMSISLDLAAAS